MEKPAQSSVRRFLRLWLVLGLTYLATKVLLDLAIARWINLRPAVLLELTLVPLGQSVVFWIVTRRARRSTAARG